MCLAISGVMALEQVVELLVGRDMAPAIKMGLLLIIDTMAAGRAMIGIQNTQMVSLD